MSDADKLRAAVRDSGTSIQAVLWLAQEVAAKLKVECPSWIQKELEGYGPNDELPDYRKLRGQLYVRDLDGEWSRWEGSPQEAELVKRIETVTLSAPVETLNEFHPIDAHLSEKLLRSTGDANDRVEVKIPVSRVRSAVRTRVHTWALTLPEPAPLALPKPDEKKTDWLGKASSAVDLWNKLPEGAKQGIGWAIGGAGTLFTLFKSCHQ